MLEDFKQLFDNQDGDDTKESFSNETGAMFQREARAKVRADKIAKRHDQADLPENRAVAGEESNRREIGREVDDLGACRALNEIHAEQADEAKNQEAAGARTEEAVVSADDEAK